MTKLKTNNTKTINAAIYCRTSRDDRDNPKLSTSSQKQDGIKLAQSLGFNTSPSNIYIDIDLSGSKPPTRWQDKRLTSRNHRPELERLMQDIESGNIQAIIIRKRDRLFRDLEQSIRFFKFLDQHNIQLHATSETIKHDGSASSKLELTMMLAIAEYQLNTTKENILQAKRRQKAEGLKMGGKLSLGYTINSKGKTVIDPEQSDIVINMFDRYIKGQSISKIIKHLKKTTGRNWFVNTVAHMIDNPCYIGMAYNADNEIIPSKDYPQLINPAIWHKAKQLRAINTHPTKDSTLKQHLLSGLIKCGYCGETMIHTGKYRYANGKRYDRGTSIACQANHKNKPTTVQEQYWIELINAKYSMFTINTGVTDNTNLKLITKLEKIKSNKTDLVQQFASGDFDDVQTYNQTLTAINDNIKSIESQIAEHKTKTNNKDAKWSDLSFDEKRIHIHQIIDRIEVYNGFIVVYKNDGTIDKINIVRRKIEGVFKPHNCFLAVDGINKIIEKQTEWNGYKVNEIDFKKSE